MLLATLRNKRSKEKQGKIENEKIGEEKINITKEDILAMIIAAFQIIMPIVFIGALLMFLIVLIFTNLYI